MRSYLLVLLYLSDELLSACLPFSSGVFALMLCILLLPSAALPTSARYSIPVVALLLLAAGLVGAILSRTPVGLFFFFTWLLLTLLWTTGAGQHKRTNPLLSPEAAMVGVAVAISALLLSLAGWDVYSVVAGTSTNRGAGLFLEPSHLAIYMVPLGMIAYQRSHYRPWLVLALLLVVGVRFSTTLVLTVLIAFLVVRWFAPPRSRNSHKVRRSIRPAGIAAAAVLAALLLPLPISVDGFPVNQYVAQRFVGLLASDDVEAQNLSSLVVLQGVEVAALSLEASRGLGVGAGNMALGSAIIDQSGYRAIINAITRDSLDLNLRDGGILFNKVVAEFGVLSLGFLWLLIRYFLRVRACSESNAKYHAVMAALLLTLLAVRALPYFAAPTCLAICSMAALVHRRANRSPAPIGQRPQPEQVIHYGS